MQELQETRVRSLGWEDPLEEDMANHSSTPAWRLSHTEEPGGLESIELQRVGQTERACMRGKTERKRYMSCPIFPFSLVIIFVINEMSNI